jgi:hypothetical protein
MSATDQFQSAKNIYIMNKILSSYQTCLLVKNHPDDEDRAGL